MSRYRLFRTSAQPAEHFQTLRDLAKRITELARHPNTGAHYDVSCTYGAISAARRSEDPETLPCAIVKILRDQARDTLGYAVIADADGQFLDTQTAVETLMRQLVILATPDHQPYLPGERPRPQHTGWAA